MRSNQWLAWEEARMELRIRKILHVELSVRYHDGQRVREKQENAHVRITGTSGEYVFRTL